MMLSGTSMIYTRVIGNKFCITGIENVFLGSGCFGPVMDSEVKLVARGIVWKGFFLVQSVERVFFSGERGEGVLVFFGSWS